MIFRRTAGGKTFFAKKTGAFRVICWKTNNLSP